MKSVEGPFASRLEAIQAVKKHLDEIMSQLAMTSFTLSTLIPKKELLMLTKLNQMTSNMSKLIHKMIDLATGNIMSNAVQEPIPAGEHMKEKQPNGYPNARAAYTTWVDDFTKECSRLINSWLKKFQDAEIQWKIEDIREAAMSMSYVAKDALQYILPWDIQLSPPTLD